MAKKVQKVKDADENLVKFLRHLENMPDEDIDPQNVKGRARGDAPQDGVTHPEPSQEGGDGEAGRGRRGEAAAEGAARKRRARKKDSEEGDDFRLTVNGGSGIFLSIAHVFLKNAGARGPRGAVLARMAMRGIKEEYPQVYALLKPMYENITKESEA